MLTLDQFRATGRDSDHIGRDMDLDLGDETPQAGRIYECGGYIEKTDDAWHLLIERSEWIGPLSELEEILYLCHYAYEADASEPVTQPQLIALRFAAYLWNGLAHGQMREIKRRNATPDYGGDICASHDFCDANEPMADAFESVVGHPVALGDTDPQQQADFTLWGEAWAIAKRDYLTAR